MSPLHGSTARKALPAHATGSRQSDLRALYKQIRLFCIVLSHIGANDSKVSGSRGHPPRRTCFLY
jgi:hypothetical protein